MDNILNSIDYSGAILSIKNILGFWGKNKWNLWLQKPIQCTETKFVSHDEGHLAQLIDTFFVFLTETLANPLLLNFPIIKNKKLPPMALIEN